MTAPTFPAERGPYTAVSGSDGVTLAEIADALSTGLEIAMWTESADGDQSLAWALRAEAGAYRIRNGDLSDVGVFADLEAAVRHGRAMEFGA